MAARIAGAQHLQPARPKAGRRVPCQPRRRGGGHAHQAKQRGRPTSVRPPAPPTPRGHTRVRGPPQPLPPPRYSATCTAPPSPVHHPHAHAGGARHETLPGRHRRRPGPPKAERGRQAVQGHALGRCRRPEDLAEKHPARARQQHGQVRRPRVVLQWCARHRMGIRDGNCTGARTMTAHEPRPPGSGHGTDSGSGLKLFGGEDRRSPAFATRAAKSRPARTLPAAPARRGARPPGKAAGTSDKRPPARAAYPKRPYAGARPAATPPSAPIFGNMHRAAFPRAPPACACRGRAA